MVGERSIYHKARRVLLHLITPRQKLSPHTTQRIVSYSFIIGFHVIQQLHVWYVSRSGSPYVFFCVVSFHMWGMGGYEALCNKYLTIADVVLVSVALLSQIKICFLLLYWLSHVWSAVKHNLCSPMIVHEQSSSDSRVWSYLHSIVFI